MANRIVFFHGGGSEEDYDADKILADSLKLRLGATYLVDYPFLPDDGSPDLGRRRQIMHEISASADGVILVAHSLGASMLLACLSEFNIERKIGGIFLIATPFWQGDQDWVQAFRLQPDFADKLDKRIPMFLYHSRDDEDVQFEQFGIYRQKLPWAIFREISTGGHQLGDDLRIVAGDISSL